MLANEKLLELLQEAASIGLAVGKNGTAGDHTVPGIAMTVYLDYLKENPTPPTQTFRRDL